MGLSAAYGFLQTDRGYVGLSSYERKMITKVDRFTDTGTWTVPAGVTYAIAHIRAGGGGGGRSGATAGGTSSVAFAGGTISALGGSALNQGAVGSSASYSAQANSGQGAFYNETLGGSAGNGALITAGGAVTPAASITVTVGSGGTGLVTGGSGDVWIDYQVAL